MEHVGMQPAQAANKPSQNASQPAGTTVQRNDWDSKRFDLLREGAALPDAKDRGTEAITIHPTDKINDDPFESANIQGHHEMNDVNEPFGTTRAHLGIIPDDPSYVTARCTE